MLNFLRPAQTPLSPAQAIDQAARNQVLVLDVRELTELQASGKAEGAVHIPLSLLPLKADPKGPDFDKRFDGRPIAVYCAAGARAGQAVQILSGFGHEAHNIGGFGHWASAGGPVTRI